MPTVTSYATSASNGTGSTWANLSYINGPLTPGNQATITSSSPGSNKYLNFSGMGVTIPTGGIITAYQINLWCSCSAAVFNSAVYFTTVFNGNTDAESAGSSLVPGGASPPIILQSSNVFQTASLGFVTPANCASINGSLRFNLQQASSTTYGVGAIQIAITYVGGGSGGFRTRTRSFARQR